MAKDNSTSDSSVFRLLQPELLTERELREILISRCVERNVDKLSKVDLVQLFQKVALPLPQREYRCCSRREQRLAKKQQRNKKHITFTSDDSSHSEPTKKLCRLNFDGEGRRRSSSGGDRLKPPPDSSTPKKTIKISNSSSSSSKDLDRIFIKSKKGDKEREQSKDKEKPKESSNHRECGSSKIVKLKRDSVSSEDGKSREKKEEPPQKKKREKIVISW